MISKETLDTVSPIITSVVEKVLVPTVLKMKERFNLDYQKYHKPLENSFNEYLHRTYKKVCIINTLVFNNSQMLLEEVYIPLTIIKNNKDIEEEKEEYLISSFPQTLLRRYNKILITDSAGMGKSTIVKKMFIDTIKEGIGIPILIELRRLNKERKIIDLIKEQISPLHEEFNEKLLLELLYEGNFIIYLDGYDEIPLSDRNIVTEDIQDFINKASRNFFIITSRPEETLRGFGEFQEFKIEPLKKKEAYELLRKYDRQGQIAPLLIKKIKESEIDNNISDFLINPLLVSLLFSAFYHKQAIPLKKHLFYRQVYDANFENHDLTKGDSFTHEKSSQLDIEDFQRILRHLGFLCLRHNQKIEFTRDELVALIKRAKNSCADLEFKESDFIRDLIKTVSLFTKDGNYYRWAHKSLQEYFAALYICMDSGENKEKILYGLYNSDNLEKYINILDLYYDIDTKAFRNTIILNLLTDFKNHIDSSFKGNYNHIPLEDIQRRKELYFLSTFFVYEIPSSEHDTYLEKHIRPLLLKKETVIISHIKRDINYIKELALTVLKDNKKHITKLLKDKRVDIFHQKKEINGIRLILIRDKEMFMRREEDEENIRKLLIGEKEPYQLDDNPNNKFNSKEFFKSTTNYIMY